MRTFSADKVLGPFFASMKRAGLLVVRSSNGLSDHLIIRVLRFSTDDLVGTGHGEREDRRTVLAADSVSRNRRGGPTTAGRGPSCDRGMRSDRVRVGFVAGPRGRGNVADY